MLWIVSVKALNRATGMQVEGRYAASARSKEEAIAWVVEMFEQTDVQFEVDARRHSSDVLVLEMKQLGRATK
jgi:hypothetical protein